MKQKILPGTCVLCNIAFYLFIQISIRLPRNTENICSPVIKLKGTFWESEILLRISSFLFCFLLRKKCLLSVLAQRTAALTSLDIARPLGTGSSNRCFLGQNLVTVRRHLFQVAQPSYSALQCAGSTSPISSTGSQGVYTQVHLPGLISRAIPQAGSPISPEHDFPERLQE